MTWYPRRRPDAEKLLLAVASRAVLIQFEHEHGNYAIVSVTQRIAVVHFLRTPHGDAVHSQYIALPAGLHDGRGWNLIELLCLIETLG